MVNMLANTTHLALFLVYTKMEISASLLLLNVRPSSSANCLPAV